MTVAIHDKTPEGRRKLKEGPKAQEKYLEELQSEWIDNHATKDPALEDMVQKGREIEAQVPGDVKARARRHEAAIAAAMGGIDGYDPGAQALVEDFNERTVRRDSNPMEHFVAVLNADVAMFGYVRDFWVARYQKQGLDVRECDVCGGALRHDEAEYPTHCTEYDMKRCVAIYEAKRAANRKELEDFCEEHDITNG